jgi:tRNA modification GTPase
VEVSDAIVALSTPPGRSGIGVIRLSGARSLELIRSLLKDPDFAPEPRRATLKPLRDPQDSQVLDQSIVTYFKAPFSFTGEDVVEISCHGSPPLLYSVVDALLFYGARTALPGEFTMRALSNGRLNLAQAEAVRDIIEAQTHAAVRQAARQLGGELSQRLQPLKDSLIEIIVPLESSLEFVEDDLPEDITRDVALKLEQLAARAQELADTFNRGRLLKEGVRVTLVGRPNVGKSSIFNKLLLSDRAIVTDIPGTTRDTLNEVINIQNVPVLITDTAGVRTSADAIEQLGIERTRRAAVDADLVLIVIDGSQPLTEEDRQILDEAADNRFIVALNKSDLENFNSAPLIQEANGAKIVPISAKTGAGLDFLRAAIMEPFSSGDLHESSFVITSARHYDLLRRAADSINSAVDSLVKRSSEEIILADLYNALRYLGEITGETTPEDVLTEIFSTFCIGK